MVTMVISSPQLEHVSGESLSEFDFFLPASEVLGALTAFEGGTFTDVPSPTVGVMQVESDQVKDAPGVTLSAAPVQT